MTKVQTPLQIAAREQNWRNGSIRRALGMLIHMPFTPRVKGGRLDEEYERGRQQAIGGLARMERRARELYEQERVRLLTEKQKDKNNE